MNRTLKAMAALMLMMVFAVGCGKQPMEPQKQAPVGAVDGLFSINENKQVYFSQGNLQYQATTKTWRFAERQFDRVVDGSDATTVYWNGVKCNNELASSTYDGWIDVFAWGTSGHGQKVGDKGTNAFEPYDYYADDVDVPKNVVVLVMRIEEERLQVEGGHVVFTIDCGRQEPIVFEREGPSYCFEGYGYYPFYFDRDDADNLKSVSCEFKK